MSEDGHFGGSSETPAGGKAADQDYGFFAGASAPVAVPSQFAGPPGQLPPPPAMPPPAGAPPAPASGQFGSPPTAALAPPPPFGGPQAYGQQPWAPVQRGGLPVWAIVAICVPAVFVVLGILAAIAIPVFLNQRGTPVAPEQLGGLSATTDPQMGTVITSIQDELARRQQGVKSKTAGYGTLQNGFVLMAFGARMDADQEFRDLGATAPPVTFGDVRCAYNATDHASMCLRSSLRGAVEVASFGATPDLARLAAVTDEAWAAQPFGG